MDDPVKWGRGYYQVPECTKFNIFGAPPQPPLWELTVLPHIF